MNNPMTYIQNGDYLIPDLKLSQQPEKPLGKYGSIILGKRKSRGCMRYILCFIYGLDLLRFGKEQV